MRTSDENTEDHDEIMLLDLPPSSQELIFIVQTAARVELRINSRLILRKKTQ